MSRLVALSEREARSALRRGGYYARRDDLVILDRHGKCRAPMVIYLEGRSLKDEFVWDSASTGRGGEFRKVVQHKVESVAMRVPCRKCPECCAAAASDWANRAIREFEQWPRTWFGTLTASPMSLEGALWIAGDPVCALPENHPERRRVEGLMMVAEVQRFWKRLRAGGHRLRYMLTSEQHRSGALHFHFMLHCEHSLTKRIIQSNWQHVGFSHVKLAKTHHACWYCAKYVKKGGFRIRASQRYGEPAPLDVSQRPLDIGEAENSDFYAST